MNDKTIHAVLFRRFGDPQYRILGPMNPDQLHAVKAMVFILDSGASEQEITGHGDLETLHQMMANEHIDPANIETCDLQF